MREASVFSWETDAFRRTSLVVYHLQDGDVEGRAMKKRLRVVLVTFMLGNALNEQWR